MTRKLDYLHFGVASGNHKYHYFFPYHEPKQKDFRSQGEQKRSFCTLIKVTSSIVIQHIE